METAAQLETNFPWQQEHHKPVLQVKLVVMAAAIGNPTLHCCSTDDCMAQPVVVCHRW